MTLILLNYHHFVTSAQQLMRQYAGVDRRIAKRSNHRSGIMNWKAIAAAALFAGAAFGSVAAADGTHDSRVAMMKKIGGAAGALGGIAKGDKPYDAEAVKAALTTIAETSKAFPAQFGPDSDKTDKEVNAKVWDNMDDFKAKAAKLSTDAETALAQLPADRAAVGAALKSLGADCGACHQAYRVLKD
jgi:cytochrome c556